MRSSILVMGALLGREGRAVTWHPGGCSIGSRPVDLHLKAFRQLGARIKEEEGRIEARAKELSGSEISFPFPSVGATENALLAAVLAKGETVILGAAMEPEIILFDEPNLGFRPDYGGRSAFRYPQAGRAGNDHDDRDS